MSAPTHSPQGERLRERTQPLAPDDESNGYAHAHLCEALAQPLVQIGEVFDPDGDVPPLAPIFDVDLCPAWALPWLGQLVGVQVPIGLDEAHARDLVRDVGGFSRGTPSALRAAASALLTGAKTLYFRERAGGDAYALEVVTMTSEVPPSDLGQPVNLVPNPSAETNVTDGGWAGLLATLARTTSEHYAGGAAFQLTLTSAGNASLRHSAQRIAVTAGKVYSAAAYFKSQAVPEVCRVYLDWYDSAGVRIGTPQPGGNVTTKTTDWVRNTVDGKTAPVGAVTVQIIAEVSANAGEVHWIDAVMIAAETQIPDYFDGSYPGYEWTGTPHASSSKAVTTKLVESLLLSQKPGGIKLTYATKQGWDYTQQTTQGGTYTQQTAAFATYYDLANRA